LSPFNPRQLLEGKVGGTGPGQEPSGEDLPRMSFFEHLEELRKRLVVSIITVFVTFLLSWGFADRIFEFLARPVTRVLPPGQHLSYTTLTEPFLMYFRVALLAGTLAASPILLWQVWLFISPALYRREKRWVLPFVFFGVVFFLSGCAFAYYEAFPLVVGFLIGVGTKGNFQAVITINEYVSMASKLILGLGLCFEMPILVFFLARLGIVSERWLLAKFKYAVLIIFVIAAIITPTPDIATQCVFAFPMIGLYLLGILIAWMFRRRSPAEPT
jgi:sec-independent protein translocase protein TatC